MALFKFFHTPKPRGFNYKPIYFDPEQEEREKRRRKYSGEEAENPDAIGDRMRDGFAKYRAGKRDKSVLKSNIRLTVILVILLFLTYLMFFR
jgi:hypothetical protein